MSVAQRFLVLSLPAAIASPRPRRRRGARSRWAVAGALMLAAAVAAGDAAVLQPPKIDPAVLARAADIAYTRDTSRARAAKALNTDPAMVARAHRAAEMLISYAPDILPATANWTWVLSVEKRPELIAYCLPAGKILVTSALFDRVRLTDDEFAAIVAHVIAHAMIGRDANDAVAAYERARGTATPDPDINRAGLQLADALSKVVLSDHYDAAAEKAADTLALELMARAGINPAVAAGAWRKVGEAGEATPPGLAALHPTRPERIAEIEAQVPALIPLYQKAFTNRPPPAMAPPMPRR